MYKVYLYCRRRTTKVTADRCNKIRRLDVSLYPYTRTLSCYKLDDIIPCYKLDEIMPVMMIDISETTNSWWDYKHWIVWCKSIFDTYHCNSAIFQPFRSPKRWGFVNRSSIERMVVVSGRGTAEGDSNGLATEVDIGIIVVVGCFEMKKWKWNGRFGAKGHVSRIGD